jgi:shikimate kinase/3-dehydroquinate synthase
MSKVFLYGPPGSGKSSVGQALAESLDQPFLDLDSIIEQKTGKTISRIITERGEATFRDIEAETLKGILVGQTEIIALGGGALLRAENRELVESAGDVICLTANLEALLHRLYAEENQRPLLDGDLRGKLSALLAKRSEHYQSFKCLFNTDSQEPAQIATAIQVALGRFHVRGMGSGYDVLVQPGGLDQLGELLRARRLENPLLVSDENVAPLYAEQALDSLRRAGYAPTLLTIPAGETAKQLGTVNSLWNGFLQEGLDRKSVVIALGGGVVDDLVGFAASTFMRGMDWVVLPTTLLSMVDASLGGKTGFDLPEGKNLVGTFHSPRLVLADPDLLSTLPDDEFRSGLAEVVKHGLIADPALFDLCSQGTDAIKANLSEVVRRGMAVKIQIIEADPYERGARTILNLGHTIGHAVEAASDYRLRHGEAVAIGLVAEARLAERLLAASKGFADRIAAVLTGLDLPTEIPADLSPQAILRSIKVDKKKEADTLHFTLPVEICKVKVGVPVDNPSLIFEE